MTSRFLLQPLSPPVLGETAAPDKPAAPSGAATSRHPNPAAEAIDLAVRQLQQLLAGESDGRREGVPRIVGDADAADFEGRKELLEQLAAILDPIFKAIAVEGAQDAHEIIPESWDNLIATTMHDHALLWQFVEAAERWREDFGEVER